MSRILNMIIGSLLCANIALAQTADNGEIPVSADSLQQENITVAQTDAQAMKNAADSAYMQKNYAVAAQLYEAVLKQGEATAIYYNLGNAYYKCDQLGKAILNYERALRLSPGDADIRANLEVARAKTVDKVVPANEIFFVTWIKVLTNCMSIDSWAVCGIACFVLLLISLALFFFAKSLVWRKAGFISGIAMLLLTVMCNAIAYDQKRTQIDKSSAIVVIPTVSVRSTPSESGTTLFVLHEGYKVTIKDDSMREWKEVLLDNGHVGWIPVDAIEAI